MTSPATPTAAYMVPRGLLPSGRALADLTFCSGIRFHGRPAACETMMNGRGSRGAVVVLRSAPHAALRCRFPPEATVWLCAPDCFCSQDQCGTEPEGCIYSDPPHDQQVSLEPFGLPRTQYSDPPHDQQVSLEPFGLPRTQDELRRRPAPEVATPRPTRGIVDKPTPLRTTPRCDSRSHPEKNHGVRCGLTMFTKQVSRPLGLSGSPSWPRG